MNFSKIDSIEQKLLDNGLNGNYKLKAFKVPVKGEEGEFLEGYSCRPKGGYTSYFYSKKHKKERIVLHFTVGNIQGDLGALSRKNHHVSVPFLIARDGNIYQLFSSAQWSYHLGKKAVGTNTKQSPITIGIELSNYGPLTKKGNNLETAYSRVLNRRTGKRNPVDVYCSLEDKEQYIKLDEAYRGYSYFASYTDTQYESLIQLLRYLTVQYDIPRAFLEEDKRYEYGKHILDFKGIVSHVNYRPSGKWDIGPAFDWERVIKGVQEARSLDALQTKVKQAQANLAKAKQALAEAEAALMAKMSEGNSEMEVVERGMEASPTLDLATLTEPENEGSTFDPDVIEGDGLGD